MRNKIFILLLLSLNLIFGSCKKTTSDIIEDTQDNSPPYTVTIDSIVDPFIGQLPMLRNTRMMGRTVPFIQDNKEFFLAGGTQWCGNTQHTILPLLLFGNQNGKWSLLSELSSVQMGEFRNWEYLPDGSGFVVAETGPEWCDITWPYGHIYLVRFKNGGLEWTKVSQNKSFYHDVSAGDINGDGILDIVGSHMGTRNGNTDNPHIYLGKADGTFQEQINVLPRTPSGDDGGDVEIFDIDKDGVNEIVHTGSNTTYTQEVYAYFKYNKQQNAYTKAILMNKSIPQNLPTETYDDTRLRKFVYNNFKGYMPAGKRFHDFNKDGQLDFIQERDGLTVWYGEGGGNFRAARINEQGKQDPVTQLPIFPNYNMILKAIKTQMSFQLFSILGI